MLDSVRFFLAKLLLLTFAVSCAGSAAIADDAATWHVAKASGEATLTMASGQKTALAEGAAVNPGDNVRTGQSGRVLLKRNEETILISPNSDIGIPADKKSSLSTVITQRAGSILLEVEKRNVKHFSVETPYLAAVVKGTQFRVSVNPGESRVDVLRGQVEVQDFKSGQYAMVMPNQAASVSTQGIGGLLLSGSGALNPVQQGTPRSALVTPNTGEARSQAPAASSQPIRMAAAPVAVPARTWAPVNPPPEAASSWISALFGSSGNKNGNGQRDRHEDIMLAVGLSCAIGFAVSTAVAMQRRRRSNKNPVKRS